MGPKVQSICGPDETSNIKTNFPITGLKKNPRRKTVSCGVALKQTEAGSRSLPFY